MLYTERPKLILLELLHFRDHDLRLISDDGRNTLYSLIKDKEGNDPGNFARSSIKQIFLVLDNISKHKSNKVKENLARYLPKIQLIFLPTRSPELNLIEVRWLWLHRQTGNKHHI